MKKLWLALSFILVPALMLSAHALAQTTAVDVNGKTYVFHGENGTYEADGIRFLIEDAQVTVRIPGEADRVLPLLPCSSEEVVEDVVLHHCVSSREGEVFAVSGGESCFSSAERMVYASDGDAAAVAKEARQSVSLAAHGQPLTPEQQLELYAPYEAFGLTYDAQTGTLRYRGQTVRRFTDVKTSNGESFSGGQFHGSVILVSYDCGTIDVETIRDYAQTNENGEGRLVGLSVKTAE